MSDTGGVSRQHCQYLKFQWFRGKYGFVTARRVSDWFQRKIQICRRWPLGRRRKENQWGAPQVVPSFGWRVPHGWKQSILPSGNWRKGGILLSVPNDAHVSRTSKNIYLTERVCVCVCVCTVRERQFCEVNVLPTRQHWLIWQIFWQYLKSDLLPLLIFERLTPKVNKSPAAEQQQASSFTFQANGSISAGSIVFGQPKAQKSRPLKWNLLLDISHFLMNQRLVVNQSRRRQLDKLDTLQQPFCCNSHVMNCF